MTIALVDAAKKRARPTAIAVKHEVARNAACIRISRTAPPRDLSAVAVVTAVSSRNGIARGAGLQHDALRRAGASSVLLDASAALRNPFAHIKHAPASAYVFHSGVPETSMLVNALLPEAAHAWRIGYWAWELPEPPAYWQRFTKVVSEVWTPSRFVADSLARIFRGPVRVVPHVVEARTRRLRDPNQPFTVLTMADSRSSFERKNPLGAVEAFRRAFGNSCSARLVLKLNGRRAEMAEIAALVDGSPNVKVITDFLDEAGLERLYRSADVLLSLHRAEGFGLPMLEAMSYGVPVIATNWSGNTEYMNEENSLPVPYRLAPVMDAAGMYTAGKWAEPDLDAAVDKLRKLAIDMTAYEQFACAAHDSVRATNFIAPA